MFNTVGPSALRQQKLTNLRKTRKPPYPDRFLSTRRCTELSRGLPSPRTRYTHALYNVLFSRAAPTLIEEDTARIQYPASTPTQPPRRSHTITFHRTLEAEGLEDLLPTSTPATPALGEETGRSRFMLAIQNNIWGFSLTPNARADVENIFSSDQPETISHLCALSPTRTFFVDQGKRCGFLNERGQLVRHVVESDSQIISAKKVNDCQVATLQEDSTILLLDDRDPLEYVPPLLSHNGATVLSETQENTFTVATGSSDRIRLWDLRNTQDPYAEALSDPVNSLLWNKDMLLCATSSSQLLVRSQRSLEVLFTQNLQTSLDTLCPAQNNTFFSTESSSHTGAVRVWEMDGKIPENVCTTNNDAPLSFAVASQDNRFLLSGSPGGAFVKLWLYTKNSPPPAASHQLDFYRTPTVR